MWRIRNVLIRIRILYLFWSEAGFRSKNLQNVNGKNSNDTIYAYSNLNFPFFSLIYTRKRIVSKAIRVKKAISIANLASSVFDDLYSYQKAISNCKKKVRLSLTLDMEKMSECLWHFTCKKVECDICIVPHIS